MLYPHYGLQKPVRRPVTGSQLLLGYDRLTHSQRAALAGLKFAGKLVLVLAVLYVLLVMALAL